MQKRGWVIGSSPVFRRKTQRRLHQHDLAQNKLTKLVLLDGPTAEATQAGFISRLEALKEHMLMLGSDNGKEVV